MVETTRRQHKYSGNVFWGGIEDATAISMDDIDDEQRD